MCWYWWTALSACTLVWRVSINTSRIVILHSSIKFHFFPIAIHSRWFYKDHCKISTSWSLFFFKKVHSFDPYFIFHVIVRDPYFFPLFWKNWEILGKIRKKWKISEKIRKFRKKSEKNQKISGWIWKRAILIGNNLLMHYLFFKCQLVLILDLG